jgi:hypothetical protein
MNESPKFNKFDSINEDARSLDATAAFETEWEEHLNMCCHEKGEDCNGSNMNCKISANGSLDDCKSQCGERDWCNHIVYGKASM